MSTLMSTHDFVDLGVYVYIFYVILYNYIYIYREIIYIYYISYARVKMKERANSLKHLKHLDVPYPSTKKDNIYRHVLPIPFAKALSGIWSLWIIPLGSSNF